MEGDQGQPLIQLGLVYLMSATGAIYSLQRLTISS